MERFSIVMPAYNAAKTIEESISSVIGQTYPEWELLVVNDGSTDGTIEIARRLASKDSRIVLLENSSNVGVADSRNRALRESTGRYLAFLDADDMWFKTKLEKQAKAFSEGADIVYGDYFRLNPNGKTTYVKALRTIEASTFNSFNPIPNLTGAYDRKIGLEFQNNVRHEDYLMWRNLFARSTNSICVGEAIATYRVGRKSLSGNKFRSAGWHWRLLRDQFGLSLTGSMVAFAKYSIHSLCSRI